MYELSRNRWKELKHFCLQYPEWSERYFELYGHTRGFGKDVTAEEGTARADFIRAMLLIETTAIDTDKDYSWYIFLAAVGWLKELSGAEVDQDVLEPYLRKFYWLLSMRKGL